MSQVREDTAEVQTLALSPKQLAWLEQMGLGMDPAMPSAIALPHAVRIFLDRLAECPESQVADVVAAFAEPRRSRRRAPLTCRSSASRRRSR